MGPKKPVSGSGGAGSSVVSSDLVVAGRCVGSVDDRSGDAMKVASKRALNALKRGNHTKAAKLIKKAIHKFERCGMVYRVQATIFFTAAACSIGDGQLKQRHIRNVSESAGTAVDLSPNSIEYALFHASFLFDNVANSVQEYDELVQKCEKALAIKYPVDPADEYLPHALTGTVTPERRISIIQGLLRSLIQKANTARFLRLILLRRRSEIKKATKTPEERRKEIEMMVAAARLLQQQSHKSKLQSGEEKLSKMSDSTFGNVHKVCESRKHGNTRKSGSSMECRDGVQSYWNSTVSPTAAVSEIRNSMDLDGLLSLIYAGPSFGEQLTSYMHNNEDKSRQGMEIIELLDKEYDHLKSLCERKRDKLDYKQAMQMLENCCLEKSQKRDDGSDIVVHSYISLLKKRQEMIIQKEKNTGKVSDKFESDAIASVIKETDSLRSSQFGRNEIYGAAAAHFPDLDSGLDDDSRAKDYIHQMNTSTELVIQRQKKELSMELNKIDAKIMQILSGMRQLELKLEPVSIHENQSVVLPLVKSFLQAHLEDLAEKDAPEKASLAELALDSKKGLSGSDTRGTQEKTKIYTVQEQHIQDHEAAEQLSTSVIPKHEDLHMDAGESGSEDDFDTACQTRNLGTKLNLKMQKGSLKNH